MIHDWLKDVKPGDRVIVSHHWSNAIGTVDRLTNTQIILKGGGRYRKKDGWRVGDRSSYGSTHLVQPTEQRIRDIKHTNAAKKLENTKWKPYPLETLQRVLEILDEAVPTT